MCCLAGRRRTRGVGADGALQSKSSSKETRKEENAESPTPEEPGNDEEQAPTPDNMTDEEKAASLTPLQSLCLPGGPYLTCVLT